MNRSSDISYLFQDDLDITRNDFESQSRGSVNDSSSDDDLPVVRRIQTKRSIMIISESSSGEEFDENKSNEAPDKNTSTSVSQNSDDDFSPIVHKNRNKQKAVISSDSEDSDGHTKYRSTRDALSSDEEQTNVKKDQSAQEARKNSVRRESANTQSVLKLAVSDSEDDTFEAEFEQNVYSPRTRKSITGVLILSESEDDVSIETEGDTAEGVEPIEIPDSDTESETKSVKNSDANLSNKYLDHRPFNVSGLKNPLQASSALPSSGLSTFNIQKALTHDSLKDIHESLSSCPAPDKFAESPSGLKVPLMPHQKHALLWLAWRETQLPRGGILADDMGLGKTLTIIAHVLTGYDRKENCSEEEDSDENQNLHNGCTAKDRKNQYSGGTLVVCPASLIEQWEHEIKTRLKPDILSYVVHHGSKRHVKARHLGKADMVITTYNIVSRECPGNNRGGPLFKIKWDRVVLDEAHVIRNHKTLMSESVTSLSKRSSWILTGTPIQNIEMDMFAYLRFLKCRPFDDIGHFKQWIENKSVGGQLRMDTILKAILLRRTKAELISAGGLTMPTKVVRVVDVILERDEMNVYQRIMLHCQTLFGHYLLQRADKDDGIDFKYNKPKANSAFRKGHKMLVQTHSGGRDVKSHEILVLLLRLRQICVHPGLITAMLEDADRSAVYTESTSQDDSVDIDLMEQLDRLNVNENDDAVSFELSESDFRMAKASKKVLLLKSNPVFDLSRPSSKFLKVLEVLRKDVLSKNENAVIVSQWTHGLEVMGMTLQLHGISYTSITGSVAVKDRGAIVERFNNKTQHSKILLLSLTAGGVGLNLVGGNHLLFIDLHWNPQLEAQAQDRIYRVGQTKPVTIYKFVSKNTIEEKIKMLQEKKLEKANGVLTGTGTNKGSKLSIDDLKSLFDF